MLGGLRDRNWCVSRASAGLTQGPTSLAERRDSIPSEPKREGDEEGGVIRILPRQDQARARPPSGAVLRGMDVFFDDLPVNFGADQDSVTVRAAFKSCETPRD